MINSSEETILTACPVFYKSELSLIVATSNYVHLFKIVEGSKISLKKSFSNLVDGQIIRISISRSNVFFFLKDGSFVLTTLNEIL